MDITMKCSNFLEWTLDQEKSGEGRGSSILYLSLSGWQTGCFSRERRIRRPARGMAVW